MCESNTVVNAYMSIQVMKVIVGVEGNLQINFEFVNRFLSENECSQPCKIISELNLKSVKVDQHDFFVSTNGEFFSFNTSFSKPQSFCICPFRKDMQMLLKW